MDYKTADRIYIEDTPERERDGFMTRETQTLGGGRRRAFVLCDYAELVYILYYIYL